MHAVQQALWGKRNIVEPGNDGAVFDRRSRVSQCVISLPSRLPHLIMPDVKIRENLGPHLDSRSATNSPVSNRSTNRWSS